MKTNDIRAVYVDVQKWATALNHTTHMKQIGPYIQQSKWYAALHYVNDIGSLEAYCKSVGIRLYLDIVPDNNSGMLVLEKIPEC